MAKALLVVDVQKFFMHDAPDDLPRRIAEEFASGGYDVAAFTVFKNNPNSNFVKSLNWSKCSSDEDIKLPNELQALASPEKIFVRATFSGFNETDLEDYLKVNHVSELTICGVDTDACVLATCFSAFDRGYKISVNFDLTWSGGQLETEAAKIIKRSILNRE